MFKGTLRCGSVAAKVRFLGEERCVMVSSDCELRCGALRLKARVEGYIKSNRKFLSFLCVAGYRRYVIAYCQYARHCKG